MQKRCQTTDAELVRFALRRLRAIARQHERGGMADDLKLAQAALAAFGRLMRPPLFDLPDDKTGG